MNRGARVHFARGIRHLCYSDLLPAIFIVFQKPIKIDPPAEVSRVARFFKPAQKGRRLEVREWEIAFKRPLSQDTRVFSLTVHSSLELRSPREDSCKPDCMKKIMF